MCIRDRLDEPTGPESEVQDRAGRVGRHFLEYLELLQPEGEDGGPEIEIEIEIELDEDEAAADTTAAADASLEPGEGKRVAGPTEPSLDELDAADLSPGQRRELLMAAAARLTGTDDPTALSYVLTALIQVDLGARQELLEAPDTFERLARLDGLLSRENWFLRQGLRPIIIDPAESPVRRG